MMEAKVLLVRVSSSSSGTKEFSVPVTLDALSNAFHERVDFLEECGGDEKIVFPTDSKFWDLDPQMTYKTGNSHPNFVGDRRSVARRATVSSVSPWTSAILLLFQAKELFEISCLHECHELLNFALDVMKVEKEDNEIFGLFQTMRALVHLVFNRTEEAAKDITNKKLHLTGFPSWPMNSDISGYLFKKGEVGIKFWRKRFFVLCSNFLIYYGDEKDFEPNGVILLKDFKITGDSDPCQFHIVTSSRTYDLKTANKDELDAWVSAIHTRERLHLLKMEFPPQNIEFEGHNISLFDKVDEIPKEDFVSLFPSASPKLMSILVANLVTRCSGGEFVKRKSFALLLNSFGRLRGDQSNTDKKSKAVIDLAEIVALLQKEYFHPFLSEQEAHSLLESQEPGIFLIRCCDSVYRSFALDCVTPGQRIFSRRILSTPQGLIFFGNTFVGMDPLIQYYKDVPLPVAETFLREPCPKKYYYQSMIDV
eukprot:TRINITY_DN10903_c0_g1_i1.p1 TRINITY_DN10903_c0_g1~~TRINITY_DN10903_c0_g1_i1.p1  ORF type:complete len:479 (-),score=69.39 TRINITY_DN10903_c0_g1_i1:17-1453(-)